LEEASDGKHGNTAVLDFGLAEPVEVDSDIVNVGKAEGVEANVSGHGSIEKRRSVHEWQSLTLLGIESNGLPGSGSHRSEGGGRANEGSEDSSVHG